jgi:hypothetical protein
MIDTAVEAQARLIYEKMQADLLAASPLGNIACWVETGSPPAAALLREAGFVADAERGDLNLARKIFIRDWGYSIPCLEAVDALRGLGPVVEVGCGSGYWSALLRNAGLNVIATDAEAGRSPYGFHIGRYAHAERMTAMEAISTYPDRAVFCSWPTAESSWATEMVRALAIGRSIALILHDGACMTGDAELAEILAASYERQQSVQIPQFPQVPDQLLIYRRISAG